MAEKETQRNDTYGLFMSALDVVNEALQTHRDSAVLGPLLQGGEKLLGGKQFGVAIYRDDPDTPFDYFTLRLTGGRFELLARGKEAPDIAWKVSQDYLRDVADNPQDYIDNPAKLDLDWLRHRVGL